MEVAGDRDYADDAASGFGDEGSAVASGSSATSRLPPSLQGPWQGLNLGNLPIFPFRAARLRHSEAELRQLLQDAVDDLADAGGNLLRVWLHTDGAASPCWGRPAGGGGGGSEGDQGPEEVLGCNWEAVEDLKWLLRTCHGRGVKVLLVLWSHDLLAVRRDNPPAHRERALRMVRTAAGTAAYVNRCLTPLVRHLATTPLPITSGTVSGGDDAHAARACGQRIPSNGADDGGTAAAAADLPALPQPGQAAVKPLPPGVFLSAHAQPPGWLANASRLASVSRPAGGGGGTAGNGATVKGLDEGAVRSTDVRTNRAGPLAADKARNGTAGSSPSAGGGGGATASGGGGGGNSSRAASGKTSRKGGDPTRRAPRVVPPPPGEAQDPPYRVKAMGQMSGAASGLGLTAVAQDGGAGGSASASDSDSASDCSGVGGAGSGPTYSSVLLGYEVLNEPEGMSWDLRLYHNYMYDMAWGRYGIEDPDAYESRPERAADRRSLQAMKAFGGKRIPASGGGGGQGAQFEGWHFVGGNRPSQRQRAAAADGQWRRPNLDGCLSAASLLSAAPSAAAAAANRSEDGVRALQGRFAAALDAASRAEPTGGAVPGCGGGGVGGGGGGVRAWYSDGALAADWEATAAEVAAAPPAPGGGSGNASIPAAAGNFPAAAPSTPRPALFPAPSPRFGQWLSGSIDEFEPWPRNLYSDSALRRAFARRDGSIGPGWDPSRAGTLDFYSPHGYPAWGPADRVTRQVSPFFQAAGRFQLDKPVLVGEFWDMVSEYESLTAQHWTQLHSAGGYMGGLGWAMLQVAEEPLYGAAPDGRQLAAPRRLVRHEKRDVYLRLLRQMNK
ncbi:hypothetical protein GPECTOR_40g559 [Gonium pectorale]|uniref:Glycoside hydrolase family 5 domain-containing protein n=1 Tax=Gonium pectorale TaxID=33097 RepID=A0A150GB68_GONPE|nr:hypothetical protein GPECTOR_40g559 [Gonium pectorale]|eukprot:KXZ46825.1 hypothetical protein GPECTOR_40g559 [Gonium pectorale]